MINIPYPRAPLAAGWALRRTRELIERLALISSGRPADGAEPLPPRRLRARAGVPGAAAYLDGGRQASREPADAPQSAQVRGLTP